MTSREAHFDLLTWLSPDAKTAFRAAARNRRLEAGKVIYVAGEPGAEMFRIVSGSVRLSVSASDGREATFLLFEPGDCFGTSSLVDGESRPQTAEALTDLELQAIGQGDFDRLRAGDRSFDDALIRLLARQMRAVSRFYVDAQLTSLRGRVIRRIREAIRSFGEAGEEGVRLSLRLSQSDLASLVGASRQSVGKVLQELQGEGLIRIEYGNVLVLDRERLAET